MDMEAECEEFPEALGQQYQIEGMLGEGAYGKVYKAKCKLDGKQYAIKIIPANQDTGRYQTRELDALIKLNGLEESKKYFIRYFKAWLLPVGDVRKLCIKMELCSGDLRAFVYENRNFAPQNTQTIPGQRFYQHVFQQILNGLDVIHSIGWVHRDIHPGNILVVNSNPHQISDIRVKIGDFGLAKNIAIEFRVSPGMSLRPCPEKSTPGQQGLYTAPELSTETYDQKVDLYSAGIVLYFLSRYPKNEKEWQSELEDLMQGKISMHDRHKDDKKLVRLIRDLLNEKPDERPTACKAKEYMLPERQGTTYNPLKTVFFTKKVNEEEYKYCSLSTFTLPALRAEIERRTGVRSHKQDLRQERTVNDKRAHFKIEDDEDLEHIFKNPPQGNIVVVVIEKEEDHNIPTEQMDSIDVVMNSA